VMCFVVVQYGYQEDRKLQYERMKIEAERHRLWERGVPAPPEPVL
jgi:hypothetical protein